MNESIRQDSHTIFTFLMTHVVIISDLRFEAWFQLCRLRSMLI